LFVSSQTDEASGFINAIAGNAAYDAKGIFLTDSAANADFRTATTGASTRWPQIRGTRPALPSGPVYDVFRTRYQMEFTDDPSAYSFTANAHDAAWLVLYGNGWAVGQEDGVISGRNIARGLRHVSSGTEFVIRPSAFQQIVAAFAQGQSVDVTGASGALDYDPATEETEGRIEVWTVPSL
jgi:branched-chain amino acid transport system substrate-binding protein